MDVAKQEGISVEPEVLEAALGVPVIPMTATRATGMQEFYQAVREILEGRRSSTPRMPEIRSDHRAILDQILTYIHGHVPSPYPESWVALKLLEGDADVTRMMQESLPTGTWEAAHQVLLQHDDALVTGQSGIEKHLGDLGGFAGAGGRDQHKASAARQRGNNLVFDFPDWQRFLRHRQNQSRCG